MKVLFSNVVVFSKGVGKLINTSWGREIMYKNKEIWKAKHYSVNLKLKEEREKAQQRKMHKKDFFNFVSF